MERKVRKTFSKLRRYVLNEPHTKSHSSPTHGQRSVNRSVEVYLPNELGGGYSMVSCDETSTVASLIDKLVSLARATNEQPIDAREWGLSLIEEDEYDFIDDDQALTQSPRAFLHPETSLSVLFNQPSTQPADMPVLKLLRIRPAKDRIQLPVHQSIDDPSMSPLIHSGSPTSGPSGVHVWSLKRGTSAASLMNQSDNQPIAEELDDDVIDPRFHRVFKVHCGKGDVRWTRDPHSSINHFDLSNTQSHDQSNAQSTLTAVQVHCRHALLVQLKSVKPPRNPPQLLLCLLPPPPLPSTNQPNNQKPDKAELKLARDREKARAADIAHIESINQALGKLGIGVKNRSNHSSNQSKKKRHDDDDDVDIDQSLDQLQWAGGEKEVTLFYSLTKTVSNPSSKPSIPQSKTDNCFVLTNLRALQIENSRITCEMKIGPGSGNEIQAGNQSIGLLPQSIATSSLVQSNKQPVVQLISVPQLCRLRFKLRGLSADVLNIDSDEETEDEDIDDDRTSLNKHIDFQIPTEDACRFIRDYVIYMQQLLTINQSLNQIIASTTAPPVAPMASVGAGWTALLKSFIGPLVFGPLRLPIYTHTIKQVLARVQALELKQVAIHSLKLLDFHLPSPALDEDGKPVDDFLPSLSLRSWRGHPDHQYCFDIFWSCPSFLLRVQIEGKRVMSFKINIEMSGVKVAGAVILRSSPYAPEQLAVSFAGIPQLSFGVGSQVVVGSVKLPFQRSIERIITHQIQNVIAAQLESKVVFPKFVPIYFPSSKVTTLLNRWNSIAKFPFTLDGRDDDEMIALALVISTQAEQALVDTLKDMQTRRAELEAYVTRPLYGEDKSKEWQHKEARRQDERVKQKEIDDALLKVGKAKKLKSVQPLQADREREDSVSSIGSRASIHSRRPSRAVIDDDEFKSPASSESTPIRRKKRNVD